MDTSKLATKEDIKGLRTELKSELKLGSKSIRREILKVEERVENLEEGQKRIEAVLGKMAKTLDGFVGRVDDLTVDNEVGTHQTRELEIKVDDHEKRLKNLESSHS